MEVKTPKVYTHISDEYGTIIDGYEDEYEALEIQGVRDQGSG